MKLLLVIACAFALTNTYGQEHVYSYSFSGDIDSSFVKQLEDESLKVEGVVSAKAKYKVAKQQGEIILFTKEDPEKKDPSVFSPTAIKAIFKRYNLNPGRFIQLKTSK